MRSKKIKKHRKDKQRREHSAEQHKQPKSDWGLFRSSFTPWQSVIDN
jgi:hypothetical protein